MYVGRESKGSDASSSPAGGESVLGTGYSMNGIESVTSPGTGTATLAYLSVPGTGTAFWLVLLLGNYAGSYNARNDADSNAGNAYGMVVWECQYGNYAGNKNVSSNNAAGNPVSK